MPIRGIEAEWPRQQSAKAPWSLRLAWLAAATVVVAGAAFRFRAISFPDFVVGLSGGSALAVLSLILAVTALRELWQRGGEGVRPALLGGLVALAALAPAVLASTATLVLPLTNDVTTDPSNPPSLAAVAAERNAAGAADLDRAPAAEGRPPSPGPAPLIIAQPPEAVFEAARFVANERGWRIAAASPPGLEPGIIVATDTTPLLGFEDDVSIRIAPEPGGTRVDMRSASRLGRHDLGTNARRIRSFLADVEARLNAPR